MLAAPGQRCRQLPADSESLSLAYLECSICLCYSVSRLNLFTSHSVSIPGLKKPTNFKCILNPVAVYKCTAKSWWAILQYRDIVVGTPCRQSSAEFKFLQTDQLARRRGRLEPENPHAGPPLAAKALASRSKIQKWCVTKTWTAKLKKISSCWSSKKIF